MFDDAFQSLLNAAKAKHRLLSNNPLGYFIASMLAGAYVGFGILLIFTVGAAASGSPYTKLLMGVSFGIALSLVIMAGSELFTGNVLFMSGALFRKELPAGTILKLLFVCYIGNWIGSILLALIFVGAGLATDATGEFMANAAMTKMTLPPLAMFLRAVLCNILVCLAVWCSIKLKSESAKLIMVFWCLFCFNTCGFEHSIANMTLLSVAMIAPSGVAVTLGGYFYNILLVSLGNIVGAIVGVALPYAVISKQ